MNFINVYINIIKNKTNYNLIIFNLKNNFLIILNINHNLYFKLNNYLYLKLLKNYFFENGFKILLLEN